MNNYVKNQVRIESQAAEAIRAEMNRRKAEKERALNEQNEKLLEGASYSVNASIHRNKQRVKTLVESLEYKDKMYKKAMCEMLTKAVKGALLLDENEYRELNPNYEQDIYNLVESFMENADFNMDIDNSYTLNLMEHISTHLPEVKTGILLNENQLLEAMNLSKMDDVLRELSKNISKKVAKIVTAEKEQKQEIQDDLGAAQGETPQDPNAMQGQDPSMAQGDPNAMAQQGMDPNAQMDPAMAQDPNAMAPGMEQGMDPNTMAAMQGQAIPQDPNMMQAPMTQQAPMMDPSMMQGDPNAMAQQGMDPNAQMDPAMAQDPNAMGPGMEQGMDPNTMQSPEEMPVQQPTPQYQTRGEILTAFDNHEIDLDTATELLKNLEIQGSIGTSTAAEESADESGITPSEREAATEFVFKDIKRKNVFAESVVPKKRFVQNTPKTGLLETFAVNEGVKMVKEGKEYNGDLALANAITYITVLEAFNESGLLNIDEAKYRELVSLAGGRMMK